MFRYSPCTTNMSFPNIENLKEYLLKIVEIQTIANNHTIWHNREWLPGIEAFGAIRPSGEYWIAVFCNDGAILKSFSPDEENNFGYININTLPDWVKNIYANPMWQSDEITSMIIGYKNGIWEEPWLAKAWWPLYPLHNAIPFNETTYTEWIYGIGLDIDQHPYDRLNQLWGTCYTPPKLDWTAVEEPSSQRTSICSAT